MKKFGFLISTMCVICAGLLSSCFSSGGEIDGSHIIHDGVRATKLNLNDITVFNAICQVNGLEGYAVVSAKTSQELYTKDIDGLLIFLREVKNPGVKTLKDPKSVLDANYAFPTEAKVIEAFCYPHSLTFAEPVKLTVKTADVDGMDFVLDYLGRGKDTISVSSTSEGLYAELPHFSSWVFRMAFRIDFVETKWTTSGELTTECASKDPTKVQTAKYKAPAGFKSSTQNAFVNTFLKKWVGENTENEFTHEYHCSIKPGTEVYCYDQPVYTLKLTSGTREFYFDIYGTPVSRTLRFISVDHNGGSGVNP
jgi:hypothetical protein